MTKHIRKIAIVIVTVLTLNFITPTYSHALDIGGILLKPFCALLAAPLDIVNAFMTFGVYSLSNGIEGFVDVTADKITDAIAKEETYNDLKDGDKYKIKEIEVTTSTGTHQSTSGIELKTETLWQWLLSMEDFFVGNVDITNINIFQEKENETAAISDMKNSVAQWYYALRNIAGVGLLCALIYTAIRILLSSIAEEKAHYKELLMDWIKATCLVVFVHLLMILLIQIGDILIHFFDGVNKWSILATVRAKLIGNWEMTQLGYLVLYGMLTYYTICFAISYFKRFLYTMLLIIIAPIVSLMYAFGKQGKEIFRKWLKEFIYNVFLQPYHLLIYTVLFGWVISLLEGASTGEWWEGSDLMCTILALIVAHFIRDAEKYFRSLFGMGQGIAGIGAMDTGDKKIKDVQRRITDIVKSVAQIAAIAVTGGAAAGIMGGAAGATASSLGESAAAARGAAGGAAGGGPGGPTPPIGGLPSGGGDGTGSNGGSGGGPGGPGEPEPEYEVGPDYPESSAEPDDDITDVDPETGEIISPEDGNPEGPEAINANNVNAGPLEVQDAGPLQVEDVGPLEAGDVEPLQVEDANDIQIEDADDLNVEESDRNEIVKYEPQEISQLEDKTENEGQKEAQNNAPRIEQLNVGNLNADNLSADEKASGNNEFKTKLNKGDLSSEIDKIANAIMGGGTRTTVEPGQTPSEARNGSNPLTSLPGAINRGREAIRTINKDEDLSNLSRGRKGILAANEAINGTTFDRRGEDNQNGQTVIAEKTERSGNDTVNANVSNSSNVEISSSGVNEGRIEELLKKYQKDGGSKEQIINAVAKETGKSKDEANKMLESAMKDSKHNSSSSDISYEKVESGKESNTNSSPKALSSDSTDK